MVLNFLRIWEIPWTSSNVWADGSRSNHPEGVLYCICCFLQESNISSGGSRHSDVVDVRFCMSSSMLLIFLPTRTLFSARLRQWSCVWPCGGHAWTGSTGGGGSGWTLRCVVLIEDGWGIALYTFHLSSREGVLVPGPQAWETSLEVVLRAENLILWHAIQNDPRICRHQLSCSVSRQVLDELLKVFHCYRGGSEWRSSRPIKHHWGSRPGSATSGWVVLPYGHDRYVCGFGSQQGALIIIAPPATGWLGRLHGRRQDRGEQRFLHYFFDCWEQYVWTLHLSKKRKILHLSSHSDLDDKLTISFSTIFASFSISK